MDIMIMMTTMRLFGGQRQTWGRDEGEEVGMGCGALLIENEGLPPLYDWTNYMPISLLALESPLGDRFMGMTEPL